MKKSNVNKNKVQQMTLSIYSKVHRSIRSMALTLSIVRLDGKLRDADRLITQGGCHLVCGNGMGRDK